MAPFLHFLFVYYLYALMKDGNLYKVKDVLDWYRSRYCLQFDITQMVLGTAANLLFPLWQNFDCEYLFSIVACGTDFNLIIYYFVDLLFDDTQSN